MLTPLINHQLLFCVVLVRSARNALAPESAETEEHGAIYKRKIRSDFLCLLWLSLLSDVSLSSQGHYLWQPPSLSGEDNCPV